MALLVGIMVCTAGLLMSGGTLHALQAVSSRGLSEPMALAPALGITLLGGAALLQLMRRPRAAAWLAMPVLALALATLLPWMLNAVVPRSTELALPSLRMAVDAAFAMALLALAAVAGLDKHLRARPAALALSLLAAALALLALMGWRSGAAPATTAAASTESAASLLALSLAFAISLSVRRVPVPPPIERSVAGLALAGTVLTLGVWVNLSGAQPRGPVLMLGLVLTLALAMSRRLSVASANRIERALQVQNSLRAETQRHQVTRVALHQSEVRLHCALKHKRETSDHPVLPGEDGLAMMAGVDLTVHLRANRIRRLLAKVAELPVRRESRKVLSTDLLELRFLMRDIDCELQAFEVATGQSLGTQVDGSRPRSDQESAAAQTRSPPAGMPRLMPNLYLPSARPTASVTCD